MLKRLVIGAGVALVGATFAVLPALAYTGTPGTSMSCSSATVAPGGSITCTANFTGGAGQAVAFSASGGVNCTVAFSPASGTTDASGNVTTTATVSSGCSGTVTLTATAGAQNVSTTVSVSGLPNASTQTPFGFPGLWLVLLLVGVGLVTLSIMGVNRNRKTATA